MVDGRVRARAAFTPRAFRASLTGRGRRDNDRYPKGRDAKPLGCVPGKESVT
jgi:hypothetical protein